MAVMGIPKAAELSRLSCFERSAEDLPPMPPPLHPSLREIKRQRANGPFDSHSLDQAMSNLHQCQHR